MSIVTDAFSLRASTWKPHALAVAAGRLCIAAGSLMLARDSCTVQFADPAATTTNWILKDKELLVYLNNLGSETFDPYWLFITNQLYMAPIFLLVVYLLWKKSRWENPGTVILFIALVIMVCDQTTNLFKYGFERLRPVNDADINENLRILVTRTSFSFPSGHASNSMATAAFLFLVSRNCRYAILLFLIPLIFAYSRIYLGLHFPADILAGYLLGIIAGTIFYRLYERYNSTLVGNRKKYLITVAGVVLAYFVFCRTLISFIR